MSRVTIDHEKCKGCQLCVFNCPTKHLTMSQALNKRGVPYACEREETTCSGCGFCFHICPESCIAVYGDEV